MSKLKFSGCADDNQALLITPPQTGGTNPVEQPEKGMKLKDKETKERLQRAMEDYIQRPYYRLYGKDSERICNFILSQIAYK